MSNPDSKLFPVRFVRDGNHLRSDSRIQGTKCRASNKGAQPEDGQTWLCSWGFRPQNAPFRYVIAHTQVTDGAASAQTAETASIGAVQTAAPVTDPVRTLLRTPSCVAGVAAAAALALEAHPPVLVLGTTNHVGALDPVVSKRVKRNRQSRDNRGGRDGQAPKTWSSAQKAAQKRPAVIRCTTDSVVARAKVLVAPAPTGKVDLSQLRFAFGQKRAQTDEQATSIRAFIQLVLAEVGSFNADTRLWNAMAILHDLSKDGPKVAEALYQARMERDRLQAEQTALNAERLRALGKRSKALKGAGDNADQAEKAAVEALKAEFAARQVPLTEALKAVKQKITGTKENNHRDSLEHQLIDCIDPWWSNWQEALAKVDGVLKAMSDVSDIYDDRDALLNTLIGLVYDYEKRLSQLA